MNNPFIKKCQCGIHILKHREMCVKCELQQANDNQKNNEKENKIHVVRF